MGYNVGELLRSEENSADLDQEFAIGYIDYGGEKIQLAGPVLLKGTLTNFAGDIILKGKISLRIKTSCHLCLEGIEQGFEFDVEERFTKEESEDAYRIEKDSIDLKTPILDNIELNLPVRFLCSKECKGLCPICGKNKNKNNCTCRVEETDPRLEVLKQFFNK